MQAAILNVKLKYLDHEIEERNQIAAFYLNNISNPNITLPQRLPNRTHVWHIFAITSKNRDNFQNYLLDQDIQTQIHYPSPVHKQLAYRESQKECLPVSENVAKSILSIPLNSALTSEEQHYTVNKINEYKSW